MVTKDLIVLGIICLLFLVIIILSYNSDESDDSEYNYTNKNNIRFPYEENNEEMFYHPTTGYKGNRANMDAYIANREKELKSNKE